MDPNDGRLYKKEAFIAEYGGTVEWDAAVRARAPTEVYRIDPLDGFAYTQTDFVAQYGGTAEWDAALPPTTTTRKKPSLDALLARDAKARARDGPKEESRIDPSDGFAYTKEDFVSQYGGTAEWEAAKLVPRGCGSYTKPLIDELRGRMPATRMGRDEEYRLDPKDGDVRTRADFIVKYGSMVGEERWVAAKSGLEPYSGELNPQVGDVILFNSKGDNKLEGTVLKRVEGMRLRVETTDELWDDIKLVYEVKQTWTKVKEVVKILAKFESLCGDFRIDVLAIEFGRCKCGRKKAQHDKKAVRRKSGLYRETYAPRASIAGELTNLKLKNWRIDEEKASAKASAAAAAAATTAVAAAATAAAAAAAAAAAEAKEDEPEYRIDPVDGFGYPWEDFAIKYGESPEWPSQWDAARSVFEVLEDLQEEYRIDPVDGGAYTKAAFVAEYGSTEEWDRALPPDETTRLMTIANTEDASGPSLARRRMIEAIAERKARAAAELAARLAARYKAVEEASASAAAPTGVPRKEGFKSINGSGERGGLYGGKAAAAAAATAAAEDAEVAEDEW